MASITWSKELADIYDAASASMFQPKVLEPAVDVLAGLAAGGAALESVRVFAHTDHYVGFETFDDLVDQISTSHHWREMNGRLIKESQPFRYVWPSELVLMGQLAGFRLTDRWGGWDRSDFTAESTHQIAVFQKG